MAPPGSSNVASDRDGHDADVVDYLAAFPLRFRALGALQLPVGAAAGSVDLRATYRLWYLLPFMAGPLVVLLSLLHPAAGSSGGSAESDADVVVSTYPLASLTLGPDPPRRISWRCRRRRSSPTSPCTRSGRRRASTCTWPSTPLSAAIRPPPDGAPAAAPRPAGRPTASLGHSPPARGPRRPRASSPTPAWRCSWPARGASAPYDARSTTSPPPARGCRWPSAGATSGCAAGWRRGAGAGSSAGPTRCPCLMAAADVLVENAGGLTCMEAFAAGLPVVSYRPIAGHGQGNAKDMEAAGVAALAHPRHLGAALDGAARARRGAPPTGGPGHVRRRRRRRGRRAGRRPASPTGARGASGAGADRPAIAARRRVASLALGVGWPAPAPGSPPPTGWPSPIRRPIRPPSTWPSASAPRRPRDTALPGRPGRGPRDRHRLRPAGGQQPRFVAGLAAAGSTWPTAAGVSTGAWPGPGTPTCSGRLTPSATPSAGGCGRSRPGRSIDGFALVSAALEKQRVVLARERGAAERHAPEPVPGRDLRPRRPRTLPASQVLGRALPGRRPARPPASRSHPCPPLQGLTVATPPGWARTPGLAE